jgi:hypothetical protein
VIVCRNMGKRSLSKMAIMRFVFLPGNELVSLFPVNEERHTALYTRSGSTVNLQGTGLEMQRMTEN